MLKTTVMLAALVLGTFAASQVNAGDTLFGGLGDMIMKGRNALRSAIPTEVKALEADGGNFRAYFFTPPDNISITCFMVAGTQKGGAACYPKGKTYE